MHDWTGSAKCRTSPAVDRSLAIENHPQVPRISTYVVCLNEAVGIERCLRSAARSDQIVVVDSGSTDGTVAIVERLAEEGLPIELHRRDWPGYAAQKQWALERCTGEWCINLDGDEELAPGLFDRLMPILGSTKAAGIRVGRRLALYGLGLPPRGVGVFPLMRIHRREGAHYDLATRVHENVLLDGPTETHLALEVRDLRALPFREQAEKELRYAALKAEQSLEAGRRPSLGKLLLNPPYAFLRTYLMRRLFLAGRAGFVRAALFGIYAFATEAIMFDRAGRSARRSGVSEGTKENAGETSENA